jgi:dihydroorotate dehydrogenase
MDKERLQATWETLESENLKQAAELSLHALARYGFGHKLMEWAQGGERIVDKRLNTEVGGIVLENPVLVGAGWDKKGWAVDGLYALGFAGTEVGTVLAHPQVGNPQPRMWYKYGAALNRLGFNSPGMEEVAKYLDGQQRPGKVGISLGKNKITPDEYAPWAHAAVADRLYDYADYFVINVASPNTPGLRGLLKPKPLTEIVQSVQAVLKAKGPKPLFVKTTVDLALEDLDSVIAVCLDNNVTGIIDTNTTIDNDLKSQYGWQGQAGGVSGDVPTYRQLANNRMKHITRITRGTSLQRIGVGAINDAATAIERIEAGAQAIQVVTGIRQSKGRVAHDINKGFLDHLDKNGVNSVQELIGVAA